jgi:hypothetical protein
MPTQDNTPCAARATLKLRTPLAAQPATKPTTFAKGAAVTVPVGTTSSNLNQRAWVVWGEGRRSPRNRHLSQAAATAEAERLAALHPGVVFTVFELTRVAKRLVSSP